MMAAESSPTDPSRDEIIEALAEFRREQLVLGFRGLQKPPQAVLSIDDARLRLRARDAWTAASRLAVALDFCRRFLVAYRAGISISDEDQDRLSAVSPELGKVQTVLDHLAYLPTTTRPSLPVPGGWRFSAADLKKLLDSVQTLIQTNARAVATLAAQAAAVKASAATLADTPRKVFDVIANYDCVPPHVRLEGCLELERRQLQEDLRNFLSMLETAPSAALELPGPSADVSHALSRIATDVEAGSITFDGITHTVGPVGAALVQAMLKARGAPKSFAELAKMEPKLEGGNVTRIGNGLRDCLPEQISKLFHIGPGSGCRVRLEELLAL